MRFLISEKLGPHKYKTPEGYLVCVDAILSRTGTQEYRRCELFGDACDDPDKVITVDRKADEVFSDKAMASFENKAICIEHPNANVNVENHNDLSVGFVRDIHSSEDNGTPVMMGTLVITDKEAVEAIESGEYKELSCGYDCDVEDEHSPQQRNIRGNHVALCKQGRAGIARIVDSTKYMDNRYTDFEYGYRDGKLGTYDKWYRYNRKDEGKEYDMGIQKAKREGYEIKNFIKGTGDSMKDSEYTFKLTKRKNDYDEFVVRAFKNGRYDEGATYYTDDWEDAVGTLKAMAKQYNLNVASSGTNYTADAALRDEYAKDAALPKIRALGKWEWDEVRCDWYDTGRKMYLIEIERNSTQDALTNDAYMKVATTTPDDDIYYAKKYMLTGKVVGHSGQDTLIRFEGTRENLKNFKNAGFFMYDPDAIIKDSITEDAPYVGSTSGEIHVFKKRNKYEVDVWNKNDLDYNEISKICRKFGVDFDLGSYGYVKIKSANKDAIYKTFAAINPSYGVGSWKILDDITKDSVYTVEYVKDNITHIVEVEAKTITDAVIKAKNFV